MKPGKPLSSSRGHAQRTASLRSKDENLGKHTTKRRISLSPVGYNYQHMQAFQPSYRSRVDKIFKISTKLGETIVLTFYYLVRPYNLYISINAFLSWAKHSAHVLNPLPSSYYDSFLRSWLHESERSNFPNIDPENQIMLIADLYPITY